MFNSIPPEQRQKYLLGIFLGLLVIGAGIFWYVYIGSSSGNLDGGTGTTPAPAPIEVNFEIFESPIFKELGTPILEIPPIEPTERPNPFILSS